LCESSANLKFSIIEKELRGAIKKTQLFVFLFLLFEKRIFYWLKKCGSRNGYEKDLNF